MLHSGFVERASGGGLLVDGLPFHFVGANVYWLRMQAMYGSRGQAKVNQALDECVRLGLTVVRTWAFGEGGADSLRRGPDEPNENAMVRAPLRAPAEMSAAEALRSL
jgi:hypothetical protein